MHVHLLVGTPSAVSDVDGDFVRCRWANSTQEECADVCRAFPADLDQVGYIEVHRNLTYKQLGSASVTATSTYV